MTAGGQQRRQRGARAVDVVGAPSSEPLPVALLLVEQPRPTSAQPRRVVSRLAGEELDDVGGDVGRRWIDHFAEVEEGQPAAKLPRVVRVERAPPAASALHPLQPLPRPPAGGADAGDVVGRGVQWLVETQRPDGTWDEPLFTGVGFPGDFYINYHLYRQVFPVSALGRYVSERTVR